MNRGRSICWSVWQWRVKGSASCSWLQSCDFLIAHLLSFSYSTMTCHVTLVYIGTIICDFYVLTKCTIIWICIVCIWFTDPWPSRLPHCTVVWCYSDLPRESPTTWLLPKYQDSRTILLLSLNQTILDTFQHKSCLYNLTSILSDLSVFMHRWTSPSGPAPSRRTLKISIRAFHCKICLGGFTSCRDASILLLLSWVKKIVECYSALIKEVASYELWACA